MRRWSIPGEGRGEGRSLVGVRRDLGIDYHPIDEDGLTHRHVRNAEERVE
jgi:hypothetical protein